MNNAPSIPNDQGIRVNAPSIPNDQGIRVVVDNDDPSTFHNARANDGNRSALVIASNEELMGTMKEISMNEGYQVRSVPDGGDEGLRLYNLFGPFDVVLINHFVTPRVGIKIDPFAAQQEYWIKLAKAIRNINPSQEIIITDFHYRYEDDVPRPPDLMDALVVKSTRQLRNLLEKLRFRATRDEVEQAIKALTPAQCLKLHHFAEWKGWAARGEGEDLLQAALLSSIVGAQNTGMGKHWNKRVDFFQHLKWAMRNIAGQNKVKVAREILECDAIRFDPEGQEISPLDNLGPGGPYDSSDERFQIAIKEGFQPQAEKRLIAKEKIPRIFRMFQNDPEATSVLQGWSEGRNKKEVMLKYGLTAKQYDAAAKRIRMKLRSRRNGGPGGEKHGR